MVGYVSQSIGRRKEMKHFYFIENESGEEFIVGANTYHEAEEIARDVGRSITLYYGWDDYSIEFQYEMTEEEAEASGLDEY
jgi:hypothetical protein